MVKQGNIIYIDFNPAKRHEQVGKRPALVISNDDFYDIFKLVVVLPITSNIKDFPFHVKLDTRTKTQGAILCEHLRTIDIEAREYKIFENLPSDLLSEVMEKVNLIFTIEK